MHTKTCNLLRRKYFNPVDYISGESKGSGSVRASGRRSWVSSPPLIQPLKNALLSRNLNQDMSKNAYC